MSLAVDERREVFPATKRGLPDNEAAEPGMGKQETTMAIGHATPKYGKYGHARASMECGQLWPSDTKVWQVEL